MVRSSLYLVPMLACLALTAACEKRGSTPPAEPPPPEADAEARDVEPAPAEAPAVAEAEVVDEEYEEIIEPSLEEEILDSTDALGGCCDRCKYGEECTGCEVVGKGQACERLAAACLQGPGGLVCVRDDSNEEVWGGLTGTEVGEAYGVGGLGLVEGGEGFGERGGGGGGGSTSGSGFGGKGKATPRVKQASAKVEGTLDPDIIRRIVRAHINEVRSCYDDGLKKNPTLAGRVALNFEISAEGKVASATVAESTLKDASVGTCIAAKAKRWRFPKPRGGGVVVVTYPFVLNPG